MDAVNWVVIVTFERKYGRELCWADVSGSHQEAEVGGDVGRKQEEALN